MESGLSKYLQLYVYRLLHFAWVVHDAKCIVVTHVCLCVCVSVCLSVCVSVYPRPHAMAACLHYCMDPDVTWSGRGCPLVVHYWVDLQSVHGLRCYDNTRNAWQSPAVIRPAHRTLHTLRMSAKTPFASSEIDASAACATLSATRPFHFVHTAGVVTRTQNVSEYKLVLALCLVYLLSIQCIG